MTRQIKDKDKLILILYVNGYKLNDILARKICIELSEHFKKSFDNSVKLLCLPINDKDKPTYEFDCINPAILSKEDCKNTIELLKEFKNILNDK